VLLLISRAKEGAAVFAAATFWGWEANIRDPPKILVEPDQQMLRRFVAARTRVEEDRMRIRSILANPFAMPGARA
jgi:hypothetical protein